MGEYLLVLFLGIGPVSLIEERITITNAIRNINAPITKAVGWYKDNSIAGIIIIRLFL